MLQLQPEGICCRIPSCSREALAAWRNICFLYSPLIVNSIQKPSQKHPEYRLSKYLGLVAHTQDAPSHLPSRNVCACEPGVCSPPSSQWHSRALDMPSSQWSSLGSQVLQLSVRCVMGARFLRASAEEGMEVGAWLLQRGLWPLLSVRPLISLLIASPAPNRGSLRKVQLFLPSWSLVLFPFTG